MTCGYCQFSNFESDHRCGRCGRRLTQAVSGANAPQRKESPRLEVQSQGANALAAVAIAEAPRKQVSLAAVESPRVAEKPRAVHAPRAAQPSLFGAELQPKIIPFQPSGLTAEVASEPEPRQREQPRTPASPRKRKTAHGDNAQGALEFLPPLRAGSRTLKTSAEAVIFCDSKVAAPLHRATAAALDVAMIAAAFGIVVALFQFLGAPSKFDRMVFASLAAMLGLTGLLYGLVFAGMGAVTPGMQWTHLRLITFDGFPLEPRARALRFLGAWISVLSGGIGLLWALLDEEHLTWHDHLSKTFPALRESDSTVVRHSAR